MFNRVRPYNLLGATGLLLFVVSFLVPFQMVDIHVHDTYYAFEMSDVFRNTACFLLALFTICTFLRQKLYSVTLGWMHVTLTILTVAAGIFFLYRASKAYRPGFSNWTSFQTNNDSIVLTLITFLIAQVLLMLNVLIGVFRRQRG